MKLHFATITPPMNEIARGIFAACDPAYYLAGGTALALQIGHRQSVDLDYFIAQDIDTQQLQNQVQHIFPSKTVRITFEQKNTLWCVIDNVKVSFISRNDALLQPTIPQNNFRFASIADIVVMKLSAICSREEYKDYFDLASVAQNTDARNWLSYWDTTHPNVDPTSWLVALAAVDSIQQVPLDLFPPYDQIDVSTILSQVVREITTLLSFSSL